MSDQTDSNSVRERMRAGLTVAMKARDMATVRAIRSALGAIDNAEAVDTTVESESIDVDSKIAGAAAGAGSTEVGRRTLDDRDIAVLLQAEIDDRLVAAEEYRSAGADERADLLRAEADVIAGFIPSSP
jgi:uncharacterized protein YqeY